MTDRIGPYELGRVHMADCLEAMWRLPDGLVDAIITDPPYYKVKGEAWDRQWDRPEGFLAWVGSLCVEWSRVLRANGSLYVFASPQMAARVECKIRESFNVLNCIVWRKPISEYVPPYCGKDAMRSWTPMSERIIFAEHHGADNAAKGEAGYVAKCDELRGFVFEPLRKYLADERDRATWTTRRVAEEFQKRTNSRTVTGMAGHWFERVQWTLPTRANYDWLRSLFNATGGDFLRREYDDLRREYDDLRREYESLRRPFSVSADVPYTDVWTFPTVSHYPGKHPCEKPQELMRHIVAASTRPGALVLDCFAGSGATLVACRDLGRDCIGFEMDEMWTARANSRLAAEHERLGEVRAADAPVGVQAGLFAEVPE